MPPTYMTPPQLTLTDPNCPKTILLTWNLFLALGMNGKKSKVPKQQKCTRLHKAYHIQFMNQATNVYSVKPSDKKYI